MQELLGHRNVRTTMVYTHVLNRGELGVVSPADWLWVDGVSRSAMSPGAEPARQTSDLAHLLSFSHDPRIISRAFAR